MKLGKVVVSKGAVNINIVEVHSPNGTQDMASSFEKMFLKKGWKIIAGKRSRPRTLATWKSHNDIDICSVLAE